MKESIYKGEKEIDLMVQRMDYPNGGHFLLANSIAKEMNFLHCHGSGTNNSFWNNLDFPPRTFLSKNKMYELISRDFGTFPSKINKGFEYFYNNKHTYIKE